MKKRILGIMLTMCMLLSALPLTSIVATAAENVSTQSVASATGAEVVSVKLNGTANGGFNKYAVKVSGTASKVQVIFPNANTYTFNRSGSEAKNDNSRGVVSIKAYDKDGNEVALGSDSTASELWVINMALKEGTYTVRAKYKNTWEAKGKTVTVSYSVKAPEEVKVTKVEGKDGSYSFKLDGTAQKIQVIHPNKMTNTFTKSNSSVSVKYYNSENAEVDRDSGEVAYEIWTISKKYNDGSYSVIAKYYNGTTYVWGTTALAFDIANGEVDITLDSDKLNALSAFTYEKNSDGKVKITGVKDNSVTEIVVPDFVYEIARGAFKDCTSLEKLTVPYVGNRSNGEYYYIGYVFGAKSVKQSGTALPETLKEITVTGGYSNDEKLQSYAFYDCPNLTNIIIGDGVTYFERSVFVDCVGLESLTVPFVGRSLEEATSERIAYSFGYFFSSSTKYSELMESLNCYIFDQWSDEFSNPIDSGDNVIAYIPKTLKKVTINGGKIGDACFQYNSVIENVVLGNNVTSIGDFAFFRCLSLNKVEIPESVGFIGSHAFFKTPFNETLDAEAGDGFIYINNVLYEYIGSATDIVIKEGTISISPYAFANNSTIGTVKCPSSLRYIGSKKHNYQSGAFYKCQNLKKIELNEGLKVIGNGAFYNCTSLDEITFPSSLEFIGWRAMQETAWYNNQPDGEIYIETMFYEYKGEMPENTTLTLREGTTGIVGYAFSGKQTLVGIDIPDSVKWIGEAAFYTTGLTEITLPKSLEQIGSYAFYQCPLKGEIIIPKGVKTLPQKGFLKEGSDKLIVRFEEGSQLETLATESICGSDTVFYLPDSVQYFMNSCFSGGTIFAPDMNNVKYMGSSQGSVTLYALENANASWADGISLKANGISSKTVYKYRENEPKVDENGNYIGSYWHYDENGNITVWE